MQQDLSMLAQMTTATMCSVCRLITLAGHVQCTPWLPFIIQFVNRNRISALHYAHQYK